MADRRILLKLSGELMCSEGGFGVEPAAVGRFARRLHDAWSASGTELALVLGGGNFLRGGALSAKTVDGAPVVDRVSSDHMGMLGTVMNSVALGSALGGVLRA